METNKEVEKAINEISKSLSKNHLILILHLPDSIATPTNCFSNVQLVQKRQGGGIKYGWTFFFRLSEKFGYYLFVTHHAVWISPQGFLVDVTPFHSELKHQPETKSGKVIFLPDDRAKPNEKGNFIISLPNKFFALKPGSKINKYIQNLQKKEFQYYKENFDIEF